ncbi:uncharacterized protein LOC133824233 [Humulus lupulus]|uniref:uncharacterized protein LOC133824233 n=1 Tax=Humulus lupulus TaxID=3486 RepID=UPI002B40A0B6|nr:uncharacterized protein LOC133824233 [Humulus lupulus]
MFLICSFSREVSSLRKFPKNPRNSKYWIRKVKASADQNNLEREGRIKTVIIEVHHQDWGYILVELASEKSTIPLFQDQSYKANLQKTPAKLSQITSRKMWTSLKKLLR